MRDRDPRVIFDGRLVLPVRKAHLLHAELALFRAADNHVRVRGLRLIIQMQFRQRAPRLAERPEVPLDGLDGNIYARILAAEILLVRKFPSEPDMPEHARIPRHRLQKCLHEPLETVALVAFGKGNGAVLGKNILKGHGAFSLKKGGMPA